MNRGVLYGIGAYLIWGVIPIYFKAMQSVPAIQIVMHRIAWSFLFMTVLVLVRREGAHLLAAITKPRVLAVYALAGLLLSTNWMVYVWSVNAGFVVEASLGYFINPLVSVALGVIFLHERLRPLQWLPVGLATVGVLYLTFEYGSLPWISLALAFSFGLYGLVKKLSPLGAIQGLTVETAILLLPALGALLWFESQGQGAFGHAGWGLTILLSLAGVVTSVPLLMFGAAARSIPLWLLGLLQYIAPTGQFLLGVLVYGEAFSGARVVGFVIIWIALLVFTLEGFVARRRTMQDRVPAD